MTRQRLLFALMLACLLAGAAHAGVYKWTDEHGKVHYSDTPPPRDAERLRLTRPEGFEQPDGGSADEVGSGAGARTPPNNEATRATMCRRLADEIARVEASPSGKALQTGDQRAARERRLDDLRRSSAELRCPSR